MLGRLASQKLTRFGERNTGRAGRRTASGRQDPVMAALATKGGERQAKAASCERCQIVLPGRLPHVNVSNRTRMALRGWVADDGMIFSINLHVHMMRLVRLRT